MIHLLDKIAYEESEREYNILNGLEYTIPLHIADSLPKVCECGFFYHVNDKLTSMYCPNPYCPETNVFKVIKIFEKNHKKINMGEIITREIFYHNKDFYRHMDFICIEDKYAFPPKYSAERVNNWINSLKELRTDVTLSEFIYMFQLDRLGSTTCNLLFTGKTLEDLEELVKNELALRKHIRQNLNLVNTRTDTENEIVLNLTEMWDIIKYYSKYFKFKDEVGKVIRLCITGSISGFANRADLIPYIEEHYDLIPKLFNTVSNKIDYLLYEEDMGSSKIRKAKSLGNAIHINDFWKLIEKYKKED